MARGIGSSEIALETPTDIKGYPRLPTVDAGPINLIPSQINSELRVATVVKTILKTEPYLLFLQL